ncbi:ATPase [Cognatiyoonia sp. IB215182]|uniref:ATPase n=1 Tax=Cognatiyoonia sp. IB215182 TaxID=3097353 RepID=UPI002A17885F|nr:ATPase [Cognatiyoonia sp. IB215182]MDX8353594.1 ATPase [Cognatiyoonia sp. IB215182]
MIYKTASEWRNAPQKRVLLFAMSGLGKTYLSKMLRETGDWFHYSIDYRIGTRYMGEKIADNAKREAMKVPFLRDLLLSNSIYIGSNISFDDLKPMSFYLGKPGDPAKGGLDWAEYTRRQDEFQAAEVAALHDTDYFINRAQTLYQYPHFVCDTGGSICEWVDVTNPDDPIMTDLASKTLIVWIKGSEEHTAELIRRFDKEPKPMSYDPAFLLATWEAYLREFGVAPDKVDPDDFIRWAFAKALAHRQPRYQAMADTWGITVPQQAVAQVKDTEGFVSMIADALEMRG